MGWIGRAFRPQMGFSNRRLPRRIRCVMDLPRDDMQSLPEGIEALRALVLATMSERDAAVTERDTLLAQNDRLRHLLPLQLRRMHFVPARSVWRRNSCNWVWKPSSRLLPKKTRRRRSEIPSGAWTMPPSGVRAVAHCQRTCRGSR